MRALIVAELATAHHGDVGLAEAMIAAAADAGADAVKLQSYLPSSVSRMDAQAEWLRESCLTRTDHERLLKAAHGCGVTLFSTPFDIESYLMLIDLGIGIKIAGTESRSRWWRGYATQPDMVSYAWGERPDYEPSWTRLTAIPQYPTPLESVGRAKLLDGWSDHCAGIDACLWAMAKGARVIEAHFCLPGRSRVTAFDKTADDLKRIRAFAESVATISTGVPRQFRERWTRSA